MKTYKNEILEQQPQKSKKISGVQTKEDWLNYRSSRTLQSENKEIYKGLNQAEVCNVEIQFKKWKHLKFWSRDIEIKSPADVAFLFRNLEKENIEHLFAVHHKKDNSVQIQHLGTGNNNSTIGDLPAILAGIEEFETQSITIVHNHPSGTLVSSKADREILKYLNKIIPKDVKINPGIILNLTSGKYLEFDSNNDIGIDYAQGEPIVKYQAKTFSKKIIRGLQ
ncbi:MAG: JAB domain-containing protein [Weeksellaceae bacterium]|nr:hypothetical protein [Acholeplasmataceae bacterium]